MHAIDEQAAASLEALRLYCSKRAQLFDWHGAFPVNVARSFRVDVIVDHDSPIGYSLVPVVRAIGYREDWR
eukprot:9694139-Lingulodinium_polyedra.AAC.1